MDIPKRTRINLTIDPDVLAYIDDFAKKNGIPRSGAISVMVGQYRQSMEGISALSGMMKMVEQEREKTKDITE